MRKYLGLELSGAKNQKTTLCVLQHFPKEKKIFLLNLFEGIGPDDELSGDALLLDCLTPYLSSQNTLTVNVPLDFPPCTSSPKISFSSLDRSPDPQIKWMREYARKVSKGMDGGVLHFTPYTQRPIELYLKHSVVSELPEKLQFEIDEALGGSRAPLTARMVFLKKSLKGLMLLEALPKLSMARIGQHLKIPMRTLENYRSLERGAFHREEILEALTHQGKIFIYDKDFKKLSQNLNSFDAFICAYTGFLANLGKCEKKPKGFPTRSSWVEIPC